ncbi:PREDICTED: DNA polymerase lambda isoform X5 [Cercocebus atys]|uniref:DNA polymerase lambda isoform X5 n=1 Tax=Cercocebus atys TaxID=9531 RepID=UPI0005F476A2|nr:PREDICTED: DNA polymerase lambda isoform X5 [Cercocebus atys]
MDPRGILKAFPKRKKIHADASSKVLAKIPRKEEGEEAEEWLSSLRAHVVRTGIGRARAELFEKQIVQHGGQLCPVQGPGVTHIVVDEGMDYERALRLLRLPRLPPGAQLVKSAWLSLCLQERRLVDVAGFSIFIPSRYLDQSQPSKAEQDASLPPGTQEALLQTALPPPPSPTRPVSPPQKTKEAPNTQAQPISDDEASDGEETQVSAADLEALISGHYPASLEGDCDPSPAPVVLDKWVCAQPSSQKATNQNLHITEKLEVLAKAYSVQGDKWRALGYAKAINALKSFHKPVTSYQVQKAAQAFNSGLLCVACGSYRRGKATCGDVDVLITHPDGRSHRGIFSRLLDSLRQQVTDWTGSPHHSLLLYLGPNPLQASAEESSLIILAWNPALCGALWGQFEQSLWSSYPPYLPARQHLARGSPPHPRPFPFLPSCLKGREPRTLGRGTTGEPRGHALPFPAGNSPECQLPTSEPLRTRVHPPEGLLDPPLPRAHGSRRTTKRRGGLQGDAPSLPPCEE